MGGTKQKKGKKGNAAQYLTRNQAIKKLQLRLSEFRRLCILKGIHPREPKKKVKGANKTYYHVKDINWLLHEPLLQTFRDIKAHDRKVRKARAKANEKLARRLLRAQPGVRLDHLVRERYPSFVDAVRDLDDPLTLSHLFARLPAEGRYDIGRAAVETSRRVSMEWQAYCVRTHALRRMFVSVKGFYYQAEVAGQAVTWLVPHCLAQVLPPDVDYRVMLTFLEFYNTLLQFTLFKLYHQLGLSYPPLLDRRLEEAAAGLAAVMKDLAGVRDAGDQARLEAAAGGGEGAAADAGADQRPELVQRLSTLAGRMNGQAGGKHQAAAGNGLAANGGDSGAEEDEEDEEEEEEEEGGSSDDKSGGGLAIDSGGSESEEAEEGESEEEEDEEEGEEEAAAGLQAGDGGELSAEARAGGEASTSGATAAGGALEVDADDEAALCASLLAGRVFFLAREVPQEPLLFVIRAFGGVAAWEGEGSLYAEGDAAITHQVVDRPTPPGALRQGRTYVQPQWVFDSVNFRVLLPADLYAPGKVPPPHLSPFVDNEAEGYTPDWAKTVRELQEAARAARQRAAGAATDAHFLEEGGGGDAAAGVAGAAASGQAPAADDLAAHERVYAEELALEVGGAGKRKQGASNGAGADGSDSDDAAAGAKQPAKRPKRQAGGAVAAAGGGQAGGGGDEGEAMADIMMSRKKRKLYERIKRAQSGQAERAAVLEQRKAALEGGKGGKRQSA